MSEPKNEPTFTKANIKSDALQEVRKGNISKGISLYREYLGIAGNDFDDDGWSGLGGAHRRAGEIDAAIECYAKAFQINPRSTYAAVNLVSLRAARVDALDMHFEIETAERLTRERIDAGLADHWTWFDLGTIELISGRLDDAQAHFQFAAEMKSCAPANIRSALSGLEFLRDHGRGLADSANLIIAILKPYAVPKAKS